MTVNGIEANHRPPVPCPRKDLGLTPVHPGSQETTRTPEQIQATEDAILDRARNQAIAVLVAANPAIRKLTNPVARSFRNAEAALEKVKTFTSIASVEEARRKHQEVRGRHAKDGAEDRRRRPRWALWALWPAIIGNSLFEAIYLGENFRALLDVGDDTSDPLFWAAYLPAAGLMVALMQVGAMLAQALYRRRSRTERREVLPKLKERFGLPQRRKSDDLPWPSWVLPIAFTVPLFMVLSAWALIRAYLATADGGRLQNYEFFAAGTLVMLAASVVVLKIITYNTYADSANEAAKLLTLAEKHSTRLLDKARKHAIRHLHHWTGLNTQISASEARAQSVIDEAVNRVRDTRAQGAQPITGEIIVPELDAEVLKYADDIETRYHPDRLDAKLTKRTKALAEQFRAPPP